MKPKIKEKLLARQLRTKGLSLKTIAIKLNVSKSSISIWVRDIPLSETQQKRLTKKEKTGGAKGRRIIFEKWRKYRQLNPKPLENPKQPRKVEVFFDRWNPEMAYVLGYFAADGTMYKNKNKSCYIAFTSTDLELLVIIKDLMGISNKIESYKPKVKNHKIKYNLQIGSKKIFTRLLDFGFNPAKSLNLKFPQVPDDVFCHFLRGYFDGDGCASFKEVKRKDRNNKIYKRLMLRLTCGDKLFLQNIQNKISSLVLIGRGSLHPHDTVYDLAYSTHDVLKLYSFMYPNSDVPCLERKKKILEEGYKSRDRSSVG